MRAALNSVHCRVKRHSLLPESNFAIDESFVEAITTQTEMVFLCEPNNPTGRTTPVPILRRILDRCTAVGALLVVDECFMDFLDDPAAHTLLPQLKDHPNLVILKAFTKLYAMAGIRLGYALCSDETAGADAAGRTALVCKLTGTGGRLCRLSGKRSMYSRCAP